MSRRAQQGRRIAVTAVRSWRRDAGQGAVEYAGMVILLAVVVGAAIFAGDHALGGTLADAIRSAFAAALHRLGIG